MRMRKETPDITETHNKAIRVIFSCKTLDQLWVAWEYCLIVFAFYDRSLPRGFKRAEFKRSEESRRLIVKAMEEKKSLLIRTIRNRVI